MDGLKILFFFIRADTRDQFSMDVIVKKKSKLNIKVRKKKPGINCIFLQK